MTHSLRPSQGMALPLLGALGSPPRHPQRIRPADAGPGVCRAAVLPCVLKLAAAAALYQLVVRCPAPAH